MSAPEVQTRDTADDLKPARVRVRQLDYITKGTNPLGHEVDKVATAYGPGAPQNDPTRRPGLDPESQEYADLVSDFKHGQLIMVRPQAYMGLIASDSIRDVETDEQGQEVEEEVVDINTMSVEDLSEWIRNDRPTVNDVVKASDGEPELAKRLLEAESRAQDGEPRQGVVRGLGAVISRG